MTIDGLIDVAIRQARKSNSKFRHGAVCFNSKTMEIFSAGFNRPILHSQSFYPSYRETPKRCYIHAEIDSMFGVHSVQLRKSSILVLRYNNNESFGNSKPCKKCMSIIMKKGIRKVYYSDCDGDLVSISL